ncbi:MAG TPA: hypothetical protein VGJ75_02935, partial [Dongiaceae bacterium]
SPQPLHKISNPRRQSGAGFAFDGALMAASALCCQTDRKLANWIVDQVIAPESAETIAAP